MHKRYTKIGEHCFEVQSCSASLINLFLKHFYCVDHACERSVNMAIFIHAGYETPLVKNDSRITSDESTSIIRQQDYLIAIDDHYRSAHLYVYNQNALITAFHILYSLFLVHSSWGIMIRCRCTVKDGEACLLLGELENKTPSNRIISDNKVEALPIKVSPKSAEVVPIPTKAARAHDVYPLKRITILNPLFQSGQIRLGKTHALLQLIDLVPALPNNEADMRMMISLLKQLVAIVPIYERSINQEDPFATDCMIDSDQDNAHSPLTE